MSAITAVFDIECYRNYFLICFKTLEGRTKSFEMYDGHPLDLRGLMEVVCNFELVSFNGNNYDLPILNLALSGASNAKLKEASDLIIQSEMKPWQIEKKYNLKYIETNHIDLIEVAPGQASLKIYGGRLNSQRMQDLPIEHDAEITSEQRDTLRLYCQNDLQTTIDLYNNLTPQIELRRTMSEQYGLDLRSKSDAQIAEAVIVSEVSKKLGGDVRRNKSIRDQTFFYNIPEYIKFKNPQLLNAVEILKNNSFVARSNGKFEMPTELETLKISIGSSVYQMGMGGLHSTESEKSYKAENGMVLVDRDVESYYPNVIINLQMFPENMGEAFLKVFKSILDKRIEAKHSGNKVVADSLKITVNGTFGKLGSVYSAMYAPNLMIQTTITGQLSLLMMIEKMEEFGISVISANTDGIVMYCHESKLPILNAIVTAWEKRTNLKTEETLYSGLYSRDVNNYIAIKPDGYVKTKGVFSPAGLQKNPQNNICNEALISYLKDGTPFDETIRNCTDITKFVSVRTVKGGAVKEGYTLGKAIRWYYANGVEGTINYKTNGNTVPRSTGAKPLMDLPDELPDDIKYDWYIKECNELLYDIGILPRPVPTKLPRKNTKVWKAMFEAGEIIEFEGKFIHINDLNTV